MSYQTRSSKRTLQPYLDLFDMQAIIIPNSSFLHLRNRIKLSHSFSLSSDSSDDDFLPTNNDDLSFISYATKSKYDVINSGKDLSESKTEETDFFYSSCSSHQSDYSDYYYDSSTTTSNKNNTSRESPLKPISSIDDLFIMLIRKYAR